MDIQLAIKKIDAVIGKPRFRAAHGQWKPYAWIVRGLVEKGHPVSESVRRVVAETGLTPPDIAERSIRSAFYKIHTLPWPENYANLAATHGIRGGQTTDPDDDEV